MIDLNLMTSRRRALKMLETVFFLGLCFLIWAEIGSGIQLSQSEYFLPSFEVLIGIQHSRSTSGSIFVVNLVVWDCHGIVSRFFPLKIHYLFGKTRCFFLLLEVPFSLAIAKAIMGFEKYSPKQFKYRQLLPCLFVVTFLRKISEPFFKLWHFNRFISQMPLIEKSPKPLKTLTFLSFSYRFLPCPLRLSVRLFERSIFLPPFYIHFTSILHPCHKFERRTANTTIASIL